ISAIMPSASQGESEARSAGLWTVTRTWTAAAVPAQREVAAAHMRLTRPRPHCVLAAPPGARSRSAHTAHSPYYCPDLENTPPPGHERRPRPAPLDSGRYCGSMATPGGWGL